MVQLVNKSPKGQAGLRKKQTNIKSKENQIKTIKTRMLKYTIQNMPWQKCPKKQHNNCLETP